MAEIPYCRNKTCINYNNNKTVILLADTDDHWLFGCSACKGIEYRTKPIGWKRAAQENSYRVKGRPEYARERAFFFQGRHHS